MADASQVNAITSYVNPNAQMQAPGSMSGGQPVLGQGSTSDDIMSQLQAQNSNISSSENDIQTQYTAAIQQLQAGGAADQTAITNKYNPLVANQQIKGQQAIEGGLENNHGYGLNAALLQTINKQSDDDMQSLVQERDSALATGQAATAKSVSDLMVKALEDKAANTQKVFDNLLNIASFGETAKKNAADQAAQQFTQSSTMTTLAAQYGVAIAPGETMTTLAAKIAPNASKEENAKIDYQVAQAEELRANAQKLVSDANAQDAKIAPSDLNSMADYVNSLGGAESSDGKGFLATMKNPGDAAKIAKIADQSKIVNQVNSTYVLQGKTKQQAQADIQTQYNAGSIPASQYSSYLDAIDTAYSNMTLPQTPSTGARGGFVAPGTYGHGGLGSVKPLSPASAEAIDALNKALKGTAFQ